MKVTKHPGTTHLNFLKGGGEMGELIRTYDWSKTILGSPDCWPQSLQTMISVMLRSKFPMFLWWGAELVQFYNDAYRPSLGESGKHPRALGEHGAACWPEIWPVIKPMIDQVRSGGEATWNEDKLIPIFRNGALEEVYWTFGYSCVTDDSGEPGGVLVICNETTQKVQLLNALQASGIELADARAEAERERDRMERFLLESPAGICILKGPEMVYDFINPIYQQLFPGRDILGKPLLEAIPEISGQPILKVLKEVYQNNQTFEGHALLIPLPAYDDGPLENRYFNFIYQPKSDQNGNVEGIMVFAFDVTEMVLIEKDLKKTKETLNSAIRAAELGVFNYDFITGVLEWDDQCRKLFGISHQGPISYENDFLTHIHPEDLQVTLDQIRPIGIQGVEDRNCDIEYRILSGDDAHVTWIKTRGRIYFDPDQQPLRFIGVLLDITTQKTNEIRKNDFIGIVSHELKTPLTSLTAYVQLLAKIVEPGNDFVDGSLQKMNAQVKKMTSMINGFLNLSRFEAGKIELNKECFNTNELLNEIKEELSIITSSHEIRIDCSKEIHTCADRDKIASVMSNLLSNAIKYSPKGKEILIRCTEHKGFQLFMIKDDGMGINVRDIPKLFDRFYRISTKTTQNISGFGIGLYLCSEIICLHGGKIWAESTSGLGSTFSFTLPVTSSSGR